MATAAETREAALAMEVTKRTISDERLGAWRCHRCGGLMVGEFCMDLLNGTGELDLLAFRCVQCGEIIDRVVLMNRGLQRSSAARALSGALGITT